METSNHREPASPARLWGLLSSELIRDADDASALAQAIVDTIRDPLLVFDQDLRVVTANRSFYRTFRMNRPDV
jgi:PAS domain-containing protein